MPRKTTPKYRLYKARNCAVVTIAGRDHYLGPYDSPESWVVVQFGPGSPAFSGVNTPNCTTTASPPLTRWG